MQFQHNITIVVACFRAQYSQVIETSLYKIRRLSKKPIFPHLNAYNKCQNEERQSTIWLKNKVLSLIY